MIPEAQWKSWEDRLAHFDRMTRPIAKGSVSLEDLMKPMCETDRKSLEEVSAENQTFIGELIDAYNSNSDEERIRIRKLFRTYDCFAWAVGYQMKNISNEELKRKFLYISILDQMFDTRDYLLMIRGMVADAKSHGLNYKGIMREVSQISSTEDRFGWGTTQQILINES